MRGIVRNTLLTAGAIALCMNAVPAAAGDWDVDMNYVAPFEFWAPNGCQDTWQIVNAFGESHWHVQVKFDKDEDGNKTGEYDMKIHANHQNGKGIGYALVMDEEGHPVEGSDHGYVFATDEDGNKIETEYSIPGTFNYWFHGTNNVQHHTVYMCIMISHGSDGNVLFHLNNHLKFNVETEEFELININAWIKCAGAQDKNGMIDCEEEPDLCNIFNPMDWF